MCVLDLVARCITQSCYRSIRPSMLKEQRYDNEQISQTLKTEICGA